MPWGRAPLLRNRPEHASLPPRWGAGRGESWQRYTWAWTWHEENPLLRGWLERRPAADGPDGAGVQARGVRGVRVRVLGVLADGPGLRRPLRSLPTQLLQAVPREAAHGLHLQHPREHQTPGEVVSGGVRSALEDRSPVRRADQFPRRGVRSRDRGRLQD